MSEIERYIEKLYELKEDASLARVAKGIKEKQLRDISIHPGYGRLLTLLTAASGARRALEIGAFFGYSGICIARGLHPEGELISLELNPEFAELAKRNVEAAGFGSKVRYRVGAALEHLERLQEEGLSFDLVFIDADKGNYPNYLDWALKLGNPGALIIADNTLLKGRIVQEQSASPSVAAMRVFNERVAGDTRLQSVLLPSYDGLAIARILP